MLILIAESKTMKPCDCLVDREDFLCHRPIFDSEAGEIMKSLTAMSQEELAARSRLSQQMVRRIRQLIYEFPNKALGAEAIEVFTGVVFKAFGYQTLDSHSRLETADRVRIISSLYGWLHPNDLIKAYRFDFTTPLAPEGKTFAAYWRKAVTDCLESELHEKGCTEVLDLLPSDPARLIDWKRITHFAKVCKADFREIRPGGETRTPNSIRLKTLRGQLLRQIVTDSVSDLLSLGSVSSESYIGQGYDSSADKIIFYTASD